MKKTSLIILGFLLLFNVGLFANRATGLGAMIVGGEITYSIDSFEWDYGSGSVNILDISPEIYWFTVDNIAFGGIVNFVKTMEKEEYNDDVDRSRSVAIYLNPGVKYFYDYNPSMSFNTSINYQIWFWSWKGSSLEKIDSSLLTISCGLDYFVTSHVALEPYIQYRKTFYENGFSNYKSNGYDFGCKLAIFLFK